MTLAAEVVLGGGGDLGRREGRLWREMVRGAGFVAGETCPPRMSST